MRKFYRPQPHEGIKVQSGSKRQIERAMYWKRIWERREEIDNRMTNNIPDKEWEEYAKSLNGRR